PVAAGPPAAGRHYRRYRASLAITGAVPGGRYDVALAGKGLRLATLEVRGSVAPARRRKVGARFGPLTLAELGWRPERPRTGGTLAVDALWAAPPGRPVAPGPVVFVHLLGPPRGDGGSVWAGRDQRPSGGPWSSASSGLFDRHLLDIDATAPPGLYTLEVGLYDPATGDRWQVAGPGADAASKRVVAGEVEIVP
ncbi:MAG: hypothetical protein ACE5EL_09245, partial [Anaerolineae bacterium]